MANAKAVWERARALVGDYKKHYATDERLLPLLQQAQDDFFAEVTNMDIAFDEEKIVIPAVPAGTSDLSAYTAAGQPLEHMMLPLGMEWKLAGDPDENYESVRMKDQARDVTDQADVTGWEFTGLRIFITRCTVAVDLRIRCQVEPTVTADGDSIIQPGTTFVLAYCVAMFVAINRGMPQQKIENFRVLYYRGTENLELKWSKSQQSKVRRFGRTMRPVRALGFPKLQP